MSIMTEIDYFVLPKECRDNVSEFEAPLLKSPSTTAQGEDYFKEKP